MQNVIITRIKVHRNKIFNKFKKIVIEILGLQFATNN